MAADQDQDQAPQTGEQNENPGDRPAWAGELKDEILGAVREMIGPLKEGGSVQAGAEAREEDKLGRESRLEDAITRAIEKVGKDRAAASAQRSTEDRLAAVEAAQAERVPVQRGPFHNLMGWGENE